jgi:MtN3 and saliva related transmembrane protein
LVTETVDASGQERNVAETLIRCWNTTAKLLQLTFFKRTYSIRGVRGNMTLGYIVGLLAALLTSLSYIPQIRKAWPRGATKDLSRNMLIVLTSGLALWVAYGVIQKDWVIICANLVAVSLSGTVLTLKLRDLIADRHR